MVTQRWQEWILQLIWKCLLINSLWLIHTFYIFVCKLHNFPFLCRRLWKFKKILFITILQGILFFDWIKFFLCYSCRWNHSSSGWSYYFINLNRFIKIYIINIIWHKPNILSLIHFVHERVLIWLLFDLSNLIYYIRWVVCSIATFNCLRFDLRFLKLLTFN